MTAGSWSRGTWPVQSCSCGRRRAGQAAMMACASLRSAAVPIRVMASAEPSWSSCAAKSAQCQGAMPFRLRRRRNQRSVREDPAWKAITFDPRRPTRMRARASATAGTSSRGRAGNPSGTRPAARPAARKASAMCGTWTGSGRSRTRIGMEPRQASSHCRTQRRSPAKNRISWKGRPANRPASRDRGMPRISSLGNEALGRVRQWMPPIQSWPARIPRAHGRAQSSTPPPACRARSKGLSSTRSPRRAKNTSRRTGPGMHPGSAWR